MSNAKGSKRASSAATSQTRRSPTNYSDESAFLAQQATDAQEAMKQTLADVKETAKEAADVRAWTQEYPLIAVGAAAVVGFFVAPALLPTSHRDAERPARRSSSVIRWLSSQLVNMGKHAIIGALSGALGAKAQESAGPSDDERRAYSTPAGSV